MIPIAMTMKDIVGGRLYLKEEHIVWLHKQRVNTGTVLCHTRGTVSVEQDIDQILAQMSEKPLKFTLDDGVGGITTLHVPKDHITMVLGLRNAVRIRLTRGDFEVQQDLKTVTRWVYEDV